MKEMERLGMIIDISHLNDAGIWDVFRYTRKPFVASHSNARAMASHPRNLTDDKMCIRDRYMDGHAATVGGCIVDSGNFDWEAQHDKFKGLTEPDESYHGIVYTQKFGKLAYIQKATAQLMRDLGSIQSPQNAFLINIGLETLHLRVPRHCESAFKAVSYTHLDVYKRQL